MSEFIIVAAVVFLVFAVLSAVYLFRKDRETASESYVCPHCDEKDCVCHPKTT